MLQTGGGATLCGCCGALDEARGACASDIGRGAGEIGGYRLRLQVCLRRGEGVLEDGERGEDGGLGAEDLVTERGFSETGGVRGGKFGVSPATFGADGKSGLRGCGRCGEDGAEIGRFAAFGEQ